jgi:prevent-host-death family protein
MDTVSLKDAKEHLEELLDRAARGEDVRIADARHGTVRLLPVGAPAVAASSSATATQRPFVPLAEDRVPGRLTDALEPFVPVEGQRPLGRLKGRMQIPARLMEPMSEEELRDWYGDDA